MEILFARTGINGMVNMTVGGAHVGAVKTMEEAKKFADDMGYRFQNEDKIVSGTRIRKI